MSISVTAAGCECDLVQVVCARMHGMRARKKGGSEDLAEWAWFGGVRIGKDRDTVFGTMVMKSGKTSRSGQRQ